MSKIITTSEIIRAFKEVHGDKYDYSKVQYKSAKDKVCIICPKHGEFWQLPGNHKAGDGCPKCKRHLDIEEVIQKFKIRYNNKYDYSKIDLTKNYTLRSKIIVICPIHGEFETTIDTHLNKSKTGCAKCGRSNPRKPVVEGLKRKEMREYRIWKGIKTRITNPNATDYNNYGAQGITMCEEWLNSFENFYKDMGPCPKNYSIDRIDGNKGYEPSNCRWASAKTQAENRRDFNDVIIYNNEIHVLKEWSRILNINYSTLRSRIYTYGLTFEEAIQEDPFHKLIELNGEKKSLSDWCKQYNKELSLVENRLKKHKWTLKEALEVPKGVRRNSFYNNQDIV